MQVTGLIRGHKERGAGQSCLCSCKYVMLLSVSLLGSCSSILKSSTSIHEGPIPLMLQLLQDEPALNSPASLKAHSTQFFIFNPSLFYTMCCFFPVSSTYLQKRESETQFLFISCNQPFLTTAILLSTEQMLNKCHFSFTCCKWIEIQNFPNFNVIDLK